MKLNVTKEEIFTEAMEILRDFQEAKTLNQLDNLRFKHSEKIDQVLFHYYYLKKGDT